MCGTCGGGELCKYEIDFTSRSDSFSINYSSNIIEYTPQKVDYSSMLMSYIQ